MKNGTDLRPPRSTNHEWEKYEGSAASPRAENAESAQAEQRDGTRFRDNRAVQLHFADLHAVGSRFALHRREDDHIAFVCGGVGEIHGLRIRIDKGRRAAASTVRSAKKKAPRQNANFFMGGVKEVRQD